MKQVLPSIWLAVLIAACGDDSSSAVCDPGRQVDCSCGPAGDGFQRCRDDGSGFDECICPDAGSDASPDVGMPDVGVPDFGVPDAFDAGPPDGSLPALPVVMKGDGADPADPTGIALDPATAEMANMACLGDRITPVGGADQAFTMRLREQRTEDTIEGLCISLHTDNMPTAADACDVDSDSVTDAGGVISLTAPADGWFAYRVFPLAGPSPSLQIAGSIAVNTLAPTDNREVVGTTVSEATLNLVPTVLGFPLTPETAVVTGTVLDCDDDALYGTIVRLFRADGTEIAEGMSSSDPHFRYFDGDNFPKADQPWTHADGIFFAANIPVASEGEVLFVEVWSTLSEDSSPQLIGCEQVPVFADTVSLINLTPRRSDAPACPSLF